VIDSAKVLFIAGWGRSGSTLLATLLGQLDGFFSAGEVNYIWDRGFLEDRPCSCSRAFHACPVWHEAIAHLRVLSDGDFRQMVRTRETFRTRHCWQAALRPWNSSADLQLYAERLASVYHGIHKTTGCRVVVDSSKFPAHAFILDRLAGMDVRIVHLVRDPRATAFSWERRKLYDDPVGSRRKYMKRIGPISSSLRWDSINLLVEYLWSDNPDSYYQRIRYEDLVANPMGGIQSIRDMVAEYGPVDFFPSSDTAMIDVTHELAGNPSRFSAGAVQIRQDNEWRAKMPSWKRYGIALMSLPLLYRYGYSWRLH